MQALAFGAKNSQTHTVFASTYRALKLVEPQSTRQKNTRMPLLVLPAVASLQQVAPLSVTSHALRFWFQTLRVQERGQTTF